MSAYEKWFEDIGAELYANGMYATLKGKSIHVAQLNTSPYLKGKDGKHEASTGAFWELTDEGRAHFDEFKLQQVTAAANTQSPQPAQESPPSDPQAPRKPGRPPKNNGVSG